MAVNPGELFRETERIGSVFQRNMHVRILTYNIHKGIGGIDRAYRLERVVEAIHHCEPDIVLLQEVDEGVPRSRRECQVDLLAERLGLHHHAYQRNVVLREGHYGNAILSRFPLTDIGHLELTIPLKKRRRALWAHCRIRHEGHTRTVLLFNFHLGLAGFERVLQLRRFVGCDTLRHTHASTPVIAAGDFNDFWGRLGRRTLEPLGFKPAALRVKTFPAFMPMRSLDRIYYRGNLRLDHSFASRTQIARQASDHLPLVADFHIPIGLQHKPPPDTRG